MILGVDISWWQGLIDFVKMKFSGALYVIIRAGSCNKNTEECYWDYNVATNAEGAEDAELPKGFYWYYREFGLEHAKGQARFFWDTIREWTIEEGLFCDVEVYDANLYNVFAFMVELQRVSGLPDEKLGIYSRALLWNALAGDHSKFIRFLCWVARYANLIHPWSDYEYMRMQPWVEPNYWQKSADGNNRGAEFGVDSDDIDIDLKFQEGTAPVLHKAALTVPKEAGTIEVTLRRE
jgi:GH25 family lysozyme M1 (1,4-beta-N-acetylmuramidase)